MSSCFSCLCLFSHPRLWTDWEIPCLFLNGKKRQHCGSGALNSIFNLLHAVSEKPSHSFFTWTQQLENCEILHSSCKHMRLCLSANVWPCLVGVYKMWEENTTISSALLMLILGLKPGDPITWFWCSHTLLLQYSAFLFSHVRIIASLCQKTVKLSKLSLCVDCYIKAEKGWMQHGSQKQHTLSFKATLTSERVIKWCTKKITLKYWNESMSRSSHLGSWI